MMRKRFLYGTAAFLAVIFIALFAARLYLPVWAVKYVNRQIAQMEGYDGGIYDLDIALWRGAYEIYGLQIYKTEGGLKEPFVAAEQIDLSVEWRALFHGKIVAQIDIKNIDLNFATNQTGEGTDWAAFIDSLTPFDINRITLQGGRVSYRDYRADPNVDIYISDISGAVTNLRNVAKESVDLPSHLSVAGTSIGNGQFKLDGDMNIIQAVPDFDVDIELSDTALPALNDFAHAAANVTFAKGNASVSSELAAANGRLTGYIKLTATDVAVEPPDPSFTAIFEVLWRGIAAAFIGIFKNHPRDQFALRIPIEGDIENPEQNGWQAFLSIFKNAFGKAFSKNPDGSISFIDALQKDSKD